MTKRAAWIETIDEQNAADELATIYVRAKDPRAGIVENIFRVHSLHPATLDDHLRLYLTTMKRKSGLSRAEREMIAVVVSSLNDCHY